MPKTMKYKFTFFQILFFSFLYSYSQKDAVVIQYLQYNNTAKQNTMIDVLAIQGKKAVFQEKYSTKTYGHDATDAEPGSITVNKPDDFDPYLQIDRSKKEVLFYDRMGPNIFLIKDNYIEPKWNITTETKKIAGYTCTKATTDFRGRLWEAWFTVEIPLPFGPWKLHGLPGLILDAKDSTNTYAFVAKSIKFEKSAFLDKDFTKLMPAHNTKPITYKQYLSDNDEFWDNREKESARLYNATVISTKAPRNGPELKYEWEE